MVGVYIYFKGSLIRIMWSVSAGRWGSDGGLVERHNWEICCGTVQGDRGGPWCPPPNRSRCGTKQSGSGLNKSQAVCLHVRVPSIRLSLETCRSTESLPAGMNEARKLDSPTPVPPSPHLPNVIQQHF